MVNRVAESASVPRLANAVVHLLSAVQNRTSALQAKTKPSPATAPLTAAMIGVLISSAWIWSVLRAGISTLLAPSVPITDSRSMSAPTQNCEPAPVTTMTRTLASASARSRASKYLQRARLALTEGAQRKEGKRNVLCLHYHGHRIAPSGSVKSDQADTAIEALKENLAWVRASASAFCFCSLLAVRLRANMDSVFRFLREG